MFEKIRKLKDRKGFTLVELIVVLVILAILAALLIPALTGYIDKANQEKVISETRMVTMAAQSTLSEAYGQGKITTSTSDSDLTAYMTAVKKLAEVENKDWSVAISVSTTDGKVGQVTALELWDGSYGCVYKDGQYYCKGNDKNVNVPAAEFSDSIKWESGTTGGTTTTPTE